MYSAGHFGRRKILREKGLLATYTIGLINYGTLAVLIVSVSHFATRELAIL